MGSPPTLLLRNGLLARFALLFLPVAGLFTATILPVLHSYEQGRISIIKARESGYLDVASRLIKTEFQRSMSDLRTLARDPLLQQYIDNDMQKHRKELSHLLQIHAEGYRRYDHIRLLNVKGQEISRIHYQNGRSIVIPHEKLQDKSQRYYFIEANKLKKKEIYVSPIDLNMEYGRIETPYKPTIRFTTPLFSSNGQRQGMLILNYHGDILLQAFHNDMSKDPLHQAMLLDCEGYWISSPQREQEWGYVLGKAEMRFSAKYPSAWNHIKRNRKGEFNDNNGMLLFTTIYPLQRALATNGATTTLPDVVNEQLQDYYWKIVLHIPIDSLYATSFIHNGHGKILLIAVYFLLALLTFLISLFTLQARHRRQQERNITSEIEDLYNLAPCGYHSLDTNGQIIKINQTELDWLGYSTDELVGRKKYIDLLTPTSQEVFRNRFPEFLHQGAVHDVELEVTRKDGSLLPIMVSATAVRDCDNNIVMSRSTVFDMTERKQLEQRLRQQATTDFLTGLNNRRNFYKLAGAELARTKRHDMPLSLLIMDIDHFKAINDTHGHDSGDMALQTFSSICRDELREIDIFGRLGGEEFAAMLPDTSGDRAIEVAYRLCKAISSNPIPVSSTSSIEMTVSIGVTTHYPSDHDIQDMLKRADTALYTAKKNGRNQVCYVNPQDSNDICTKT